MRFVLLPLVLVGLEAAGPAPAPLWAQRPEIQQNLGHHHYSVNGSADAQRYFDQGLRLFWAFNHVEAIRSFREGERLDSTCAMCAFGVALAYGPNINAPMARVAAESAHVASRRAQLRATDSLEIDLIDALAARYTSTDTTWRARQDTAYARALRKVVVQHPRNFEARVLYADALMNLNPWNYWHPDGSMRPGTRSILAQLDTVMKAEPDHPGACHLYIHAVEARYPERAVRCAERLAALMPGAGHLVHMPAHIYIRVGRYTDAVEANRRAVHVDHASFDLPGASKRGIYPSGYMAHNHQFLSFAASMMGSSRIAIDQAFEAVNSIDPALAAEVPWVDAIVPVGYQTLVTFGQWDRILTERPPSTSQYALGMWFYSRGVAFAAKRRWAEANAALDSVGRVAANFAKGDGKSALLVAERALAGEIDMRRGALSAAVRSFESAVILEDALPYTEPPMWYYPTRHSLGRALVMAGRFSEAEDVYRRDLERFPENGWSLYGLAQALTGRKKSREAAQVLDRFNRAWAKADIKLDYSRL